MHEVLGFRSIDWLLLWVFEPRSFLPLVLLLFRSCLTTYQTFYFLNSKLAFECETSYLN